MQQPGGQASVAHSEAGTPHHTREIPDYPSVFDLADHGAVRQQHRALRLAQIDDAVIITVALVSTMATLVNVSILRFSLQTVAAALLVLMLAEKFILERTRFQHNWYESRAAAESIKSAAWRYMMHIVPFEGHDPQADSRFLVVLRERVQHHPSLASAAEGRIDAGQITPYMRRIRQLSSDERKAVYLRRRLDDQILYYSGRSELYRVRAREAYWLSMALRGAALFLAVARFVENWLGSLVGFLLTVVAAVAAWTQLLRYDELTKSYGHVALELERLRRDYDGTHDEQALRLLMVEVEGVLSREQTMWTVKRS